MVEESCLVFSPAAATAAFSSSFTVGKAIVIKHGIFPLSKVVRRSVLNLICTKFTHFEYQRICLRQEYKFSKAGERRNHHSNDPLLSPRDPISDALHPNPAPQLAQQKHVFFCSKTRIEQFCLCRYEIPSNSGARCATSLFY